MDLYLVNAPARFSVLTEVQRLLDEVADMRMH